MVTGLQEYVCDITALTFDMILHATTYMDKRNILLVSVVNIVEDSKMPVDVEGDSVVVGGTDVPIK